MTKCTLENHLTRDRGIETIAEYRDRMARLAEDEKASTDDEEDDDDNEKESRPRAETQEPSKAAPFTVRGTEDDAKTDADLSKWEKEVRADATQNGGVVPPATSGHYENPVVRLNDAPKPVPPPGDTESELNGLISECRFLLHEIAFHSARLTYDPNDRIRFLTSAEGLARTAASVGETVAKLRHKGGEPALLHEHHQLVTVEHVQRTRGEGGRGKRRKSSHQ